MNGNDIVANLRAAIERELVREDWPHRPTCPRCTPPHPGLWGVPFGGLVCRCDAADTWMRMLEAHLKIVELHPAHDDGEGDLLCQKCRYEDHELYAERCYPCPTLLALAEAHGIAVAGPGDDAGRPPSIDR
ncbi:MAG TPA: hypothetical protein DGT23_32425 [Micromonosporaceae bacterium]|nr:hypothetical protein [Micromonosporaceae bacterium]